MKKRSPARRRDKRTQNLTKYGQYAQQDGDEGMDAHSHPPSAGSTLRGNPPGIAPTRLQQGFGRKQSILYSLFLSPVWAVRGVRAELLNGTDLDCQLGDAGLDGSASVADVDVHAVILGVIQAERPHFHNDGRCTVCGGDKKNINTPFTEQKKRFPSRRIGTEFI